MKRLLCIMLVLALLPLVSCYADLFTVSYTTYDTTYDAILDMYIRVLNANGDDGRRHDLFNDLIYTDFHHDHESSMAARMTETKNRVGYCIYDLNNDGISELIIGENYSYVNEVFTLDNGKVRELIRAGGKYSCSLLDGGVFYRYSRSGGAFASSAVWKMNGTAEVQFVEGYYMDNEFGSVSANGNYYSHEYQWFRMRNADDGAGSAESIVSVDEYQAWLNEQDQKLLQLNFIPFAAYEQGINTENAGIISVNGKMDGREEVRVRAAAKRNSKLVKNLKTGTYVGILGEEDNYYKVTLGKTEGYIQKDFLTKASESNGIKQYHIFDESSEKNLKKAEENAVTAMNNAQANKSSDSFSSENPDPGKTEEPWQDFDIVFDHYEEVEVQKSRQVYDHDEYTIVDDGEGHFQEVPHPVYRTEYYTETEQRPVYLMVPRENAE